jgi:nitrogen fixation NifU-like protein
MMNNGTPQPKLDDLYQEVILDHNKRPRNFEKLADANASAHGHNPLCGDDYEVYLVTDAAGTIQKVRFQGQGCAISKASASMMTTMVEGKSKKDAEKLKDQFIRVITDDAVTSSDREAVGRLKIFEGVKQFPVRVKCAALAWRTLEEALKDQSQRKEEVSTE